MQNQNEQPMAVIIRNDECANAAQRHFSTNFLNASYNLKCKLDGHRLVFPKADLPEKLIRESLNRIATWYPEIKTTQVCVEYLNDHTRDYRLQ